MKRARLRRRRGSRSPEGIRITKVGLWYVLFAVLVAIAATNTGNNGLYLVVAIMLGVLVVSGVVSRYNVDRLEAAVEVRGDVYANEPFSVDFSLANRSRLFSHWFLLVAASKSGAPRLVPYLPRKGVSRGRLEILLRQRGLRKVPSLHVSSLFPFGFFRKGVRYALDEELLVFPEIYSAANVEAERTGRFGDVTAGRAGWGHDLYALRGFRQGDDPRGIHWKQTAKTGSMVYMERESEETRRLSILFDNGIGRLAEGEDRERFERLVSEAATTAVDYLGRDFEVELVTRERALPFARGRRQRTAILELLAVVEPVARSRDPLRSRDPGAPQVRLALEPAGGAVPRAGARGALEAGG